jgi:hypothetical protein
MKITGHETRDLFDRYHIISTDDLSDAMRKLESALLAKGAKLVQTEARDRRLFRPSRT